MTPNEALGNIKRGKCFPYKKATISKIAELCEKQIPKTPTLSWTGNEYETQCPVCHGVIDEGFYLEYRQYCSRCGQALDWSNVE